MMSHSSAQCCQTTVATRHDKRSKSGGIYGRTCDAHLEEDGLGGTAKLHDVAQLGAVDVLLWNGAEEVHAAFIDAQDQLGRQQAYRTPRCASP